MNEAYESLLTRRSWRKFTDKPVPEDLIAKVVKAGGQVLATALSVGLMVLNQKRLRESLVAISMQMRFWDSLKLAR